MADTGKMDLNREVMGKVVDWITFAAHEYFFSHTNSGRPIYIGEFNKPEEQCYH